jgi:hypothetical protein
MQAANRAVCQLKSFRNSHPFHPKDVACRRGGYGQFMPLSARDSLVDEEILQFYGSLHANRLETVTWLPMPQSNRGPHPLSVKVFTISPTTFPSVSAPTLDSPFQT